jgi:hypothetical protein
MVDQDWAVLMKIITVLFVINAILAVCVFKPRPEAEGLIIDLDHEI